MNAAQAESMFRQWWSDTYPTPPSPHLVMVCVGWGLHVQNLQANQPGGTTLAEAKEAARQLGGANAEIVHRYLNQQVGHE